MRDARLFARTSPTALVAIVTFAALGCGSDAHDGVVDPPKGQTDYFRMTWQGQVTGTFEVSGIGYTPTDRATDYVIFANARVNRTLTRAVGVNKAISVARNGGFDFGDLILNPAVLGGPGHYEPKDCTGSPEIGGCAQLQLLLGRVIGSDGSIVVSAAATLLSVANTLTVDIVELTPTHIRATFSGHFAFRTGGQDPAVTVTVTGASLDASTGVPR